MRGRRKLKGCTHVSKSVDIKRLKSVFHYTGIHSECPECRMEQLNSPHVAGKRPLIPRHKVWICLKCGHQACGRLVKNHRQDHFNSVSHNDRHCLVMDFHEFCVWCYKCGRELIKSLDKEPLRTAVKLVKEEVLNILEMLNKPQLPQPSTSGMARPLTSREDRLDTRSILRMERWNICGLTNLGNTCFLNAVLQCIAQTPFLLRILENLQESGQAILIPGGRYQIPGSNEEQILEPIEGSLEYSPSASPNKVITNDLTENLYQTIMEIRRSNGDRKYSPHKLLLCLQNKFDVYARGEEQDAHELLNRLLEVVRHEDFRRYQRVILIKTRAQTSHRENSDEDIQSRVKFYEEKAKAKFLGADPIFRGNLISIIKCLECHHSTVKNEPFLDLSLHIPITREVSPETNEGQARANLERFSIQNCLDHFLRVERLTGDNRIGCDECTVRANMGYLDGPTVRTERTLKYIISKAPPVLILHLKRFKHTESWGHLKLNNEVSFPTILDLTLFCKRPQKTKLYSLFGVVVHTGIHSVGHYVAFVKTRKPLAWNDSRWSFLPPPEVVIERNPSTESSSGSETMESPRKELKTKFQPPVGQWWQISDESVIEVDEEKVLQAQAYLLFYERIL